MAKSRNNLLGVGGQRKKLSRAEQQGAGSARGADRKAAEDKKQELVRKMRERAEAQAAATAEPTAEQDASPAQG
ncbi:DUF6243 family protein [Streptomyces griseus]|uniref:DUF6243 family protein n=1 Tax=Streptomyces griseus TaxID=1911 RepID=UPI00225AA233|nr:DUF6243 family protein [Streptomyces griseus]MCX4708688.1 DUF6243 family protein [Streptomyces griseus]